MQTNPRKKVLPYDDEAEQSLLGSCLLSTAAVEILSTQLSPEDFYVPKHATIARHLMKLYASGVNHIDTIVLADELDRAGELTRIGGHSFLITTLGKASVSAIQNYARIILDYSARRRMLLANEEIHNIVADGTLSIEEAMDVARRTFGSVEMGVIAGEPDPDAETFLDGPEDYDWLVNGLLERGNRLILTGPEGSGKSMFLLQTAVSVSAGLHPLRFTPIEPIRVLLVDVENSPMQIRRRLRKLVLKAKTVVGEEYNPGNLRICAKTEGLDLIQRTDVRWLMERCEANHPDLLVIGPMYKMHGGDPIDEGPARAVARALDMIRARYGCAIMMEAHSPYTQDGGKRLGRPYGASLWSRWPEFGYGISMDPENPNEASFEPWRGPREEREWPKTLQRGGEWPWMEGQPGSILPNQPTYRANLPEPPSEEFDDLA